MPRPKTKNQLIELNNKRFQELTTFIETLPPDVIFSDFPIGTLNRNIRDVIAHLYHWNLMMMSWYDEGMIGQQPKMPAEGYTWRTVPNLNVKINKIYSNHTYEQVLKLFQDSHRQISAIIDKHDDDELFTKKKYKWTGSTSLAAYLISSTCSHYDWALKLIKSLSNK